MQSDPFDLRLAFDEHGIALKRYRTGENRAVCPECGRGPRDDTLAVRIGRDDSATWLCHRCGFKGGVRPNDPERPARPAPVRQERQPEPERYDTLAPFGQRLWASCRPIEPGSVAASYLERRGCALPAFPDESHLRWHPDVRNRKEDHTGPALVALVTDVDTGEPISLHRTWIAPDGSAKAKLDRPRLLLARHRSDGVVRLWPDDEITLGLVLGEGIETCLAGAQAGLTPVWATLSAGNLAAFPVLPGIEGLTVLVDHDRPNPTTGRRPGISAALALVRRYTEAGFDPDRDIKVILPPAEGQDAADLFGAARHG